MVCLKSPFIRNCLKHFKPLQPFIGQLFCLASVCLHLPAHGLACEPVSYRSGKSDVQTTSRYGLVLMGGGTDVDAAMRWMISRSGGGDFIVLRASGADGYNDYLYQQLGGLNSVESLIIDSRAKAFCPSVATRIRQAEALFIAGGDQSKYLTYWQGTPVMAALQELAAVKKVPIGGTSAGLAILGEWVFSAEKGSITSEQALKDPYDPRLTLRNDFLHLPLLQGVLTDSHFNQRQRQGRLLSFMARVLDSQQAKTTNAPGWLKGMGVDEETAVLIDETGQASVTGQGKAWFFQAQKMPTHLQPNQPLSWEFPAIKAIVISGEQADEPIFDVINWKLLKGQAEKRDYAVSAGKLHFKITQHPLGE